MNMKLQYVDLDTIKQWPRNPKTHDLEGIDGSIDRFGFVQPLLMDETTGRLVAGHGRLETLVKMKENGEEPPERIKTKQRGGAWMVPVIRGIAFENEAEAEAYLVADNRWVEKGGWDEELLSDILLDQRDNATLEGLGWSEAEVDEIAAVAAQEIEPDLGRTNADEMETYKAAEVKQITLFLEGEEYDSTINRMQAIMTQEDISTHTGLFLHLLESYENSQGE